MWTKMNRRCISVEQSCDDDSACPVNSLLWNMIPERHFFFGKQCSSYGFQCQPMSTERPGACIAFNYIISAKNIFRSLVMTHHEENTFLQPKLSWTHLIKWSILKVPGVISSLNYYIQLTPAEWMNYSPSNVILPSGSSDARENSMQQAYGWCDPVPHALTVAIPSGSTDIGTHNHLAV